MRAPTKWDLPWLQGTTPLRAGGPSVTISGFHPEPISALSLCGTRAPETAATPTSETSQSGGQEMEWLVTSSRSKLYIWRLDRLSKAVAEARSENGEEWRGSARDGVWESAPNLAQSRGGPNKRPAETMAKGKKKKVDKEPQLRPRISAAAAAAASSPFYPPETNGSSAGSSRKKIGPQDSERIRRLSREGISIDVISKIWNATPKEVLETLELEPKDSAREEACAPLVKRLTTDPAELCCPISRQLMWDPVVAQDGYTYERCNIERWLGTKPQSPMTGTPLPTPAVLNPNQHVKSAIRSFKEDTVAEILALVPQLPSTSVALELLSRGEQFVRPDLPDASAQKKLTSLLRLRMKLPGGGEAIQEIVGLFLENPHRGGLQKFLCELDGSQLTYVLPELDDDTIAILQKGKKLQPACKWLVDQELSRRLAGRLTEECPLKLMRLLEESSQSPHDEKGDRLKAAGLVLASSIDRLDAEDLEEMDVQLLSYARGYLRDKDTAIMDSEHFFSTDLGMFTAERWPPQSSGAILTELAFRLEDEEEKFQLLVEAHEIDGADSQVRAALIQQLHGKIYRSDSCWGLVRCE
eukprot:s761_g25.t1